MSAAGSWWNGLATDGSPVGMDHGKLMEWAWKNDMQITIGWRCDFTFPDDKVNDPLLKGARMVRTGPDRPTFEVAARLAGWEDMAEKFKEAGL